jgi:AdoMet-dependent rRNA methyltransferase SPB1
LQSLKLATEFLKEGGTFVTKVFRSKDYNPLLWVFNQLFTKVEATKPPSSRNVSAEIFVVCRGYKAPKRIDPRFLDSRSVFAELSDPTPNNEAKVYNPEQKKRKREGYEEGDYTQYKEIPASEFIQTTDPIAMLATYNKLTFDQSSRPNGDLALATLNRLPETTQEIRDCCADLKVLGRGDFRKLLKWRLAVREIFGFASKKKKTTEEEEQEEVAEVESMDDEMKIQEELQELKDKDNAEKKKQRRKENERKQKEIIRMQMGMTTPFEIGMEQAGINGDTESMFALKPVDKAGELRMIVKGKMHTVIEEEKRAETPDEDDESDPEEDALERQLDAEYEAYRERREMTDAKYRAKRARQQHDDEEWEGISDYEHEENSDDDNGGLQEDDDSSDDTDDEDNEPQKSLLTDLTSDAKSTNGLTKRAAMFFDQDVFKGIDGLDDIQNEDSGIDVEEDELDARDSTMADTPKITTANAVNESKKSSDEKPLQLRQSKSEIKSSTRDDEISSEEEEDGEQLEGENEFEVGEAQQSEWDENPEPMKNGRPNIDIITAEAMTLAHELATGKKTKADMIDEGFNKWALRDTDGLPEWFLDDENKYSKPQRPITAAAATAIKEKLRALNARPIKKVREAKARKKFKAAQKLEKLRKKSALLADDEGMTEKDKANSIAKLMAKASKKKPKRQVSVVVAKGGNRGISGRPKGTKGKYKMVDKRLKKDVRAEKRLAKKKK